MKLLRNSNCPCGSNLKFKKCCNLRVNTHINEVTLNEMRIAIDKTLDLALDNLLSEDNRAYFEFSKNIFARLLNLDTGSIEEEYLDYLEQTEFGYSQFLDFALYSMKVEEKSFLEKLEFPSLAPKLLETKLSLFEVDSSFKEFLVLKDIFSCEYHFILLVPERHLHIGDLLSGRIYNSEHGKLFFSNYGHFRIDEAIKQMLINEVLEKQTKLEAFLALTLYSPLYQVFKINSSSHEPASCSHSH